MPRTMVKGDPILLAERASVTFPDACSIKTSTPAFKNFSRIETELASSDLRNWFVPCTRCNDQFVILFSHIVWPKTKAKNGKTIHDIAEAKLECPACQYRHDESERIKSVEAGTWIITQPENRGSYGYWANAFITILRPKREYNGWMHYFGHRYLKALKLGSTGMRTYVNQVLTESFEIESEKAPEYQLLYDRREPYLVYA